MKVTAAELPAVQANGPGRKVNVTATLEFDAIYKNVPSGNMRNLLTSWLGGVELDTWRGQVAADCPSPDVAALQVAGLTTNEFAELVRTAAAPIADHVHRGVVGAGNMVIKSKGWRDMLSRIDPNLVSVAMEDSGVVIALFASFGALQSKRTIDVMLLRGISDPGTEEKKKLDGLRFANGLSFRSWAMQNASRLAIKLVADAHEHALG